MKKKHASSLHLLIIIFLLCNACSPYPQDVQKALQLAHHNTAELEKVLNHYKNLDSLKYEAACFLIANMPYHKSRIEMVLPTEYNDYFAKTDSLYYLYFGDMTAKQIKEFAFRIPFATTWLQNIRFFLNLLILKKKKILNSSLQIF